ncbi:MAG: hypothetical protein LBQ48_05460, partial [Oscillospiraceae bacterium]|nr:hypothetical protein [Oscillospiraceae bacterium]
RNSIPPQIQSLWDDTRGIRVNVEVELPIHIGYDFSPVSFTVSMEGTAKPQSVGYRIYNLYRAEISAGIVPAEAAAGASAKAEESSGETSLSVPARWSASFTAVPPEYGWYCAVADVFGESGELLTRTEAYFGIADLDCGVYCLKAGESCGSGWTDPLRAAFCGLKLLRLNTRIGEAEIERTWREAEQCGVLVFMQFEMKEHCTEEHVRGVVRRYKNKISVYEVINEPNLFMKSDEYIEWLKEISRWVREEFPEAYLLAPAVCGVNLEWVEALLKENAQKYFTGLSIHDYEGHESVDPTHWQWKFEELEKLLKKYNAQGLPLWNTEHGMTGIRMGISIAPAQAVRETLHRDLNERAGIPENRNYYYYLNEHGYAGYPAYLWSRTGPHPAALALRSRSGLLQGTLPTELLDFGAAGNRLFLGQRYDTTHGEVVLLRNLGLASQELSFPADGEALTAVDAFGNRFAVPIAENRAKLTLSALPVYVLPKAEQRFDAPELDFGENLAGEALFSYNRVCKENFGALNNQYLEAVQSDHPNREIWEGLLEDENAALEIAWEEPKTIDTVVFHSLRADNSFCALLDADLDYWDGGQWRELKKIRAEMPESTPVQTFDHQALCWYLDQNIVLAKFPAVTAKKLRLRVLRTTYGFCPDKTAAQAFCRFMKTDAPNPQKLHLREIEVYHSNSEF